MTNKKTPSLTKSLREALLARGYQQVKSKSLKYTCFTHPTSPSPLWLGKAGALRLGLIPTKSWALTDAFKQRLLKP